MVGGKEYRPQNKAAHTERKRPKSPRNHTAGSVLLSKGAPLPFADEDEGRNLYDALKAIYEKE